MSDYCVSIVCPAGLQEKLMDALLEEAQGPFFTSTPTFVHGAEADRLSTVEQVLGRSHAVHVQLLATTAQWAQVLERLKRDFSGTGLRYWACEVSIEGVIA